jgi:4-amino-4-deoxy-L-arabinose transferase-like glycosyltransferase
MTFKRFSTLDSIIIFFAGLIAFTLGLNHQEIIGFESRFYLFALEMWRQGFTGFPTTYQEPYPDYPVTSTAFIYLTAKVVGALNKWVAVFPSAVAAASTLSATYLIGALENRRTGWYATGFLLFTLAFLTEARTISLDMYVTAVTAWSFYFAYTRKKVIPWFALGLLLMLGFAIRGPIGIIIPSSVLFVVYYREIEPKYLIILAFFILSVFFVCSAILLSTAYHVGGSHFMQYVLQMEISGRMEVNRTPPAYFYFVESIGAYAITYPLAMLIFIGTFPELIKKNASRQIHFLRKFIMWVLIIMIGLSIPADKKVRYILAIAPGLALISASLFIVHQNKFLVIVKKCFYFICGIFPGLCIAALLLLYRQKIELNYDVLFAIFSVIQLLVIIFRNKDTNFFLAVLSFFLVNYFILEKINLDSNQTRSFVEQIENLREKQQAKLGFYREGKDGLAIKYLVNMPHEENPLFIADLNSLPASSLFLIASEENFNAIHNKKSLRIMGYGKIGHDKVVVFSKPVVHR